MIRALVNAVSGVGGAVVARVVCTYRGHRMGPWMKRDRHSVYKNGWQDRWCHWCGKHEQRVRW